MSRSDTDSQTSGVQRHEPDTRRAVLVTGAGTGIGAAIARRFAAGGDSVLLTGLDAAELDHVAAGIVADGGTAETHACDVTDPAARRTLFARLDDRFGRIDTLVNNAGVSGKAACAPALEETEAHHSYILSINLSAAYHLAQQAGHRMRAQGGGSIINISSVGAAAAQLNAASYCMSKAGLDAMARVLAVEWAPYGIRANAVAPGDIRTATSDAAWSGTAEKGADRSELPARITPLRRKGTPEDVAGMVWFLASDAAAFVTGETLRVDGGFLAY